MPMMEAKIVPDSQPNADGVWKTINIPQAFMGGMKPFSYVPEPGHHIVQVRKPSQSDPQDGGPMHAHFLGGRA